MIKSSALNKKLSNIFTLFAKQVALLTIPPPTPKSKKTSFGNFKNNGQIANMGICTNKRHLLNN